VGEKRICALLDLTSVYERDFPMFPPFLISLIVGLVVVGLVLWVLGQIPIDAAIQRIIRVVIIVCVVLWLLSVLLGWGGGLAYPAYPHR
jgi:uncharacterized protein (DUF983 family)